MSFEYRGPAGRRLRDPRSGDWGDATNGAALIIGPMNRELRILFSNGGGWEHVSVSTPSRCPNWPEMCYVKDLFWDPEDCVAQFHPPASQYVNDHEYCLHLWRKVGSEFELPPKYFVGGEVPEEVKAELEKE